MKTKVRRTTVVTVAVVIVVSLVVTVLSYFEISDDRAYPGSRIDKSLDQIKGQFRVKLPDCPIEELRYWSADYIDDVFYLKFTSSDSCLRDFVHQNGLVSAPALRGGELALAHDKTATEFGWKFAPDRSYERYVGTARDLRAQGVVETNASQRTIYLYAFEI